jgi:hypothetical protein
MTPSVGALTWADGDSGCIRQRRAKVRRDRRDSELADINVSDRVKTPEPAEYSSPLLSYSGMDVRLSSVRSGRRLLGAAGRDLPDASIIDSSSIRITSERDPGFESCSLQRGVCLSALNSGAGGEEPRAFAAVCTGMGTREGTCRAQPGTTWPFSLTGIDAVPPKGSEYSNEARKPRDSRGLCMSSLRLAQLASNRCCSAQSSGRSSSVRRVAVSSIGCRPCKIASTSSGLKKLRPTRRRTYTVELGVVGLDGAYLLVPGGALNTGEWVGPIMAQS